MPKFGDKQRGTSTTFIMYCISSFESQDWIPRRKCFHFKLCRSTTMDTEADRAARLAAAEAVRLAFGYSHLGMSVSYLLPR